MAGAIAMYHQDSSNMPLGGSSAALLDASGAAAQLTLQPVFIPRQPSGLSRNVSIQQPSSPTSGSHAAPSAAGADWAFLLRSAAALRNNSLPGADSALMGPPSPQQHLQGRADSPQVLASPGNFLMTSTGPVQLAAGQHGGLSNSASALFGSNSMVALDALGQLSADALASATADRSNSYAMLSNGNLAPTLSGMYADGGVQTLYSSNDTAAVAAAAAAAAARATTTQSILQQQAAAAAAVAAGNAGLANGLGSGALNSGALERLSGSLNLNNYMKLEESLSGTLFGPGGAPATLSPKPVSASLYIKNLPADADKLFLYEKFSPFGAILSVKVLNDPQSGHCRGVGFVNFAEHASALRSIQALHGTKVGDKLLHVSLQTPRLRAAAVAGM